ncbi:MAG: hypothetical protein V4667_08785 [Bacteroidota bacterium]
MIRFFIILSVYYFIAFAGGIATWGVGVPVVGALGGLIVKWLFYNEGKLLHINHKYKLLDNEGVKFASIGFITGIIGLIFYSKTNDIFAAGVGFGVIIGLWQLGVSIKCIRKVETIINNRQRL